MKALDFRANFDFESIKFMMTSMTRYIQPLAAEAKTWPGYEKIAEKLNGMESRFIDVFMELYKKDNSWGYNVLNHGDFHIRNMMFKKHPDGSLDEVAFLDFQMPFYHSPGFDVYSLINSIGTNDVRDRKFEVVKSYHTKFVENLKRYGYSAEIPTLMDLHQELLRLSSFGKN